MFDFKENLNRAKSAMMLAIEINMMNAAVKMDDVVDGKVKSKSKREDIEIEYIIAGFLYDITHRR